MRFLLCVLLSILLISCGGDSGSSGSSSRGNSNTPPTAQDVTIDTGYNDFITYDLSSDINDVETAKSDLVIEVIDKPKYSTTGELTENCPLDNNNTGKIMWNSNTEFYYEVCHGPGYTGSVYFTYKVIDESHVESEVRKVTINNLLDS